MKRLFCMLLVGMALQAVATKRAPIIYLNLQQWQQVSPSDSLALLDLWDELHATATLQGIVNRKEPRLYIDYVESHGIGIDRYWWNRYRQKGAWLSGRDTMTCLSVVDALQHFRGMVKGVVVYDPQVASTSNVASTVAGIEDVVAVRYDRRAGSLYRRVVEGGLRLPVKVWLVKPDGTPLFTGEGIIPGTDRKSSGSLKCDPYLWLSEKYLKTGRCPGRFAGYYIDQKWREQAGRAPMNHHQLTNHDFFVARKGFFFDLSPWADEPATDDRQQATGTDVATLKELLSEAKRLGKNKQMCYIGGFPAWAFKYTQHAGGKHEDVATEWQFSELISHYSAFKDADAIGYGALANASFWQHFPLRKTYPQPRVTRDDLKKRGLLDENGRVREGRNYMVIYVGDYDASSWVSQCTPRIWDAPERGRLPMMWAISPVLSERIPHALHYIRTTASGNDYFVAADNGAGYLMPGTAEATDREEQTTHRIDTWKEHCRRYYRLWGLHHTGFIIDGNGPAMGQRALDAYAEFSEGGIVPQKYDGNGLHRGMPVLRSDWDLVSDNPEEAAQVIADRVRDRDIPFHWFRCILKSPDWYERTVEQACRKDPSLQLLDAPSFFLLYKIWVEQRLTDQK